MQSFGTTAHYYMHLCITQYIYIIVCSRLPRTHMTNIQCTDITEKGNHLKNEMKKVHCHRLVHVKQGWQNLKGLSHFQRTENQFFHKLIHINRSCIPINLALLFQNRATKAPSNPIFCVSIFCLMENKQKWLPTLQFLLWGARWDKNKETGTVTQNN